MHIPLDFARVAPSFRIFRMFTKEHTHPATGSGRAGGAVEAALGRGALGAHGLAAPFSVARRAALGALSAVLAASLAFAVPVPAHAVDVETARNSLDAAERQMGQIVSESERLQGEISASQERIDETTQQAMEAQQAMLDGREVVGDMMHREYTTDSLGEMVTLVFSAESFNDFLRRLDYVTAVMDAAAEEVQAQKERKAAYEGVLEDLNAQRDEQQGRLGQLEEKKQEAQRVVDEAGAALDNAEAEEAARLQALADQAAALQQEQAQQQVEVSEEWSTGGREETAAPAEEAPSSQPADSPAAAAPETGQSSTDGGSASSGGSVDATGWQTGSASAYGGSSDPSVSNPATTATGAVCDDSSMGVAIPQSWPNYRSYLGRSVEISYNGMTVVATVNDCGYMGGGSRSLDLQPGVFKAFGFSTCQAWGVRTVSYRFL